MIQQEHKNLRAFINKITNVREMKVAALTAMVRLHFL
jgi:hypothetical protein